MTIHRIGVISDTHGLLRPEALAALRGRRADPARRRRGHAGGAGGLQGIAPVLAVRGNVDRGAWANELPETQTTQVGEAWIYMLHDLHRLDLDPAAGGFSAVISGHSHRAGIDDQGRRALPQPGRGRTATLHPARQRSRCSRSKGDAPRRRSIELPA